MTSVGIDVSKKTLDICVLTADSELTFKITNDHAGFTKLLDVLVDYKNVRVCLESTNVYWREVAFFLHNANYFVCVENPAKIYYYSKMQMSRLKNDKHDAQLIARYCQISKLRQWFPESEAIIKLRNIINLLHHFKRLRASEKTKLHDVAIHLRDVIKRTIAHFDYEICLLNNEINVLLKADKQLKKSHNFLSNIPGIGEITASILLSVLASNKNFKNANQFVAFLGLNPSQRRSGTALQGRDRISKLGKSDLRSALYLPAMTAYRLNSYQCFVERLSKNGKSKRVILTALMRKLAVYAFTIYKKQEQFKIIS